MDLLLLRRPAVNGGPMNAYAAKPGEPGWAKLRAIGASPVEAGRGEIVETPLDKVTIRIVY
jgi:hypothetical protein